MRGFMMALIATLALAGCASVNFRPVDKYDMKTQGLRIPERKPLVVLMGNTVSIQWVCNTDRQQAMRFSSFLAKHHLIIDFDTCGGIETLNSEQDSTAIPLKLLEYINEVAQQFLPGTGTSTETGNSGKLAFQIFDVRFDYDGGIDLVPLVNPGEVLRIDTGTGLVSGGIATSGQGQLPIEGTPVIPGN
ncbi:MAG: hypothetical protein EOP19_00770 [Hyphomicrobiales bacterium]|nr:MAG: hypothetical protein EOP19_00770 [Hyphomicrobiales bacterium]